MQRTNIYLDDAQVAALEVLSRAEGVSRAELVRRFVDRGLGSRAADLDGDLAAIEESFGVGADEDLVLDRRPDSRAEHLQRVRRR